MTQQIEYFKKQAKKLYNDYKTQYTSENHDDGSPLYSYNPKYFDIDEIIYDFNGGYEGEENFTLMKLQHIIAQMAGCKSWGELIKLPVDKLTSAKLMLDDTLNEYRWEEFPTREEYFAQKKIEIENNKEIYEEVLIPSNNEPAVMLECLHCGKQFLSNETKLIKLKGHPNDMAEEVCKHWPECNGRAWDLMPAGYDKAQGESNEK